MRELAPDFDHLDEADDWISGIEEMRADLATAKTTLEAVFKRMQRCPDVDVMSASAVEEAIGNLIDPLSVLAAKVSAGCEKREALETRTYGDDRRQHSTYRVINGGAW